MIRKALSLGAGLLALVVAPAAMAAPAPPPQVIVVGGSVDLVCGGSGLSSATLNLTNSLAGPTGFVDDTAYVGKSASIGSLWCNGVNTTATITHVNLTNTAAPNAISPNFTHVVTFVPEVTLTPTAGPPVVLSGDVTNTVIGAFSGSATVSLLSGGSANTNLRPLAGSYAGSVSFTVTPAS